MQKGSHADFTFMQKLVHKLQSFLKISVTTLKVPLRSPSDGFLKGSQWSFHYVDAAFSQNLKTIVVF